MEANVVKNLSPLGAFDVTFFVLTLAISVIIGIYFANKNDTLEDYMLGGRDQKLLPVSVSMMTSFISGLTLIGSPAEFYHHGFCYSFFAMAMVISVPFSAFILMPVFYRLNNLSIFNYLEQRYSCALKRIVSLVFIVQMTLYNAAVLYVPSLSLRSVLGISDLVSIGAVGASCLFYCTLGGIKAVIWTDFFQAMLMYFSLLCICVGGTLEAGGFWQLIQVNKEGRRMDPSDLYKFDLTTRHTLYTITIGATLINVFMNGANQIQVQRALSLPSLRLAQWSQLITALFTALISLIASYVGLVIYNTFKDCDPFNNGDIDKRDAIVIYYISTHLTYIPGLRGIFVAGIFAATLSTLSSFQNSMSALVIEDFIKPIMANNKMSSKTETHLSKILAFTFGTVCILLTFAVGKVSGLLQVVYTLFGALGAPFICAFFMGMMTRYANTIGMMCGMLSGFALGVYVQFYQAFWLPPLEPSAPLSLAGCPAHHLNTSSVKLSGISMTPLQEATDEFNLAKMSYLWLPAIALALSFVVSSVVSLLTGGWSQQVEDKFLVAYLHIGDGSVVNESERAASFHDGCYRSQKDELVGQIQSCIRDLEAEHERQCSSSSTKV